MSTDLVQLPQTTPATQRTHKSIVQEVTALPSSRHAAGFLSLRLHSRYALFGFAQANEMCLATDNKTADVGGGELSCSDIACQDCFACPAKSQSDAPDWDLADEVAAVSQVYDDRLPHKTGDHRLQKQRLSKMQRCILCRNASWRVCCCHYSQINLNV